MGRDSFNCIAGRRASQQISLMDTNGRSFWTLLQETNVGGVKKGEFPFERGIGSGMYRDDVIAGQIHKGGPTELQQQDTMGTCWAAGYLETYTNAICGSGAKITTTNTIQSVIYAWEIIGYTRITSSSIAMKEGNSEGNGLAYTDSRHILYWVQV